MPSNSIDRVHQGAITTRSNETLIRDDQEFATRLAERKQGLLARLTASDADRKISAYQSKMVEQAANARVENYRMFLEVQRQAIKEVLDGFLEHGKLKGQGERTRFFEAHGAELHRDVNDAMEKYMKDMNQRLEALEASNMQPTIKQRLRRMFEQRMDEHEGAITFMLQRFASIPSGGV